VAWLDGRKNVLFLRWRGERYILHRATGFPYISPISSGLRWRGERDIPKNVFFLREEGLIYDAPESAYIPKNVSFLREEVLIYVFSSSARRF
jgi:hypothetical protein